MVWASYEEKLPMPYEQGMWKNLTHDNKKSSLWYGAVLICLDLYDREQAIFSSNMHLNESSLSMCFLKKFLIEL